MRLGEGLRVGSGEGVPEAVTEGAQRSTRSAALPLSLTMMSPLPGTTARPMGVLSCAGAPPAPLSAAPAAPVPLKVVVAPAGVTARTRCPAASATSTLP